MLPSESLDPSKESIGPLGITEQAIDILLVEDSPTDAMLTIHAFSKAKRVYRIHAVNDGIEAMAFLRRQNSYAENDDEREKKGSSGENM